MSEKYYNYNDLEQMQEKAKKIDYEPDKKDFLKSMNQLEQKMALFYSKRPYDILNYLDKLNERDTNVMLNELTNEEISKLLELFTSEDKKNFYATFSNSLLVNKFISNDKQAFSHVDKLDLERKIELLDSSKVSTQAATKEIYNTLSMEEKQKVEAKINSIEGSLVVENVIESNQSNLENNITNETELKEINLNEQQEEEIQEKQQDKKEQEEKNDKKLKEEFENNKEINDFLKSKLEQYKQQNPKFKDFDETTPDLFNLLPDELKDIVTSDFNLLTQEQKEQINNKNIEDDLLNEFQKTKEICEAELINNVKQVELEKQEEIVKEQYDYVKTL